MADNIDPSLGKVEDLTKTLLWDTIVKGVLSAYGLNFWPLNVILNFLTDKIYGAMKLAVDFEAIKFLNSSHQQAYAEAASKLKILATEKGPDSPEYKEARDAAKKAFAVFTHLNISP